MLLRLVSIVPKYIEACYPAAVDGTIMQRTKLKIEIIPGNVRCQGCKKVFNLTEHGKKSPASRPIPGATTYQIGINPIFSGIIGRIKKEYA